MRSATETNNKVEQICKLKGGDPHTNSVQTGGFYHDICGYCQNPDNDQSTRHQVCLIMKGSVYSNTLNFALRMTSTGYKKITLLFVNNNSKDIVIKANILYQATQICYIFQLKHRSRIRIKKIIITLDD